MRSSPGLEESGWEDRCCDGVGDEEGGGGEDEGGAAPHALHQPHLPGYSTSTR